MLDAFEHELGVAPARRPTDGEITLRAVECLGGCSTPTIVAVDHRYRQSVTPEDVPAIVEELRGELRRRFGSPRARRSSSQATTASR